MKFQRLDAIKADSQSDWEQIAKRTIEQFLPDMPPDVAEIIVARRSEILDAELARMVRVRDDEARTALKDFEESLRSAAAIAHFFQEWVKIAEDCVNLRLRDIPETDAIAIRGPRLEALKREFVDILDSYNGKPAAEADVKAAAMTARDRFDRELLACAMKYHADSQRAATDQGIDSRRNELTRHGWNVIELGISPAC